MIAAGYDYPAMVLKPRYFNTIWKNEFSFLCTRDNRAMKSHCNTCGDLQALVEHEDNPKILTVLRHFQFEHRRHMQGERQVYYSKRMLSQKDPEHCMSMICDGMQQKTCAVPYKVNDKGLILSMVAQAQTNARGNGR